jgi:hypothetical protein
MKQFVVAVAMLVCLVVPTTSFPQPADDDFPIPSFRKQLREQARAAEIQALIDYNVSLAALRQAEGTLLAQFDVVIDTLPPHPTPPWARF